LTVKHKGHWSFVYAKAKNVPESMKGDPGVGDVWTWTAIDAKRLASRVQVTTDGLKVYREAMEAGFGADVDYAQLVKAYEAEPIGPGRS
jgi:hypothetical protein